ncbi:MAG: helix-turn-helix transcriptional regulator [Archangium sp.]
MGDESAVLQRLYDAVESGGSASWGAALSEVAALVGAHSWGEAGLVDAEHSLQVDDVPLRFGRRGRGFNVQATQTFARLKPHLARAWRLRSALGAARAQAGELQQVLDAMSVPALVVGGDGRVWWASSTVASALTGAPTLEVRARHLTSSQPALAQAIRRVLAPAGAERDATIPRSLSVPRAGRSSLALLAWPLPGELARVMVVLHDPESAVRIEPRLLITLYGLTETEAALASALVSGRSVLQFALDRGTSELTARVHLKRVLKKTGAGGQVDLVRVLLGGALPRTLDDR